MAGETLLLMSLPFISQDILIPQGKAQLCSLALPLPHVETCHSDAASPLPPSAGITLMVEGGLKGWSKHPEIPCKAHMGDVLSQELCQETLNHLLAQSNPSPALCLTLGVP